MFIHPEGCVGIMLLKEFRAVSDTGYVPALPIVIVFYFPVYHKEISNTNDVFGLKKTDYVGV